MCVCVCVHVQLFPKRGASGQVAPVANISARDETGVHELARSMAHVVIHWQSKPVVADRHRAGWGCMTTTCICTFIVEIDHASCNPLTWVTDSQCGCGLSFRNTLIVTIQAHADSVMSTTTTTQGNWMQLVHAACKLEPLHAHTCNPVC